MSILSQIGKAASIGAKAGLNTMGGRTALGVLTAGAVVKGLSDTVGQSAIDNAMEIAFDNPEADRAVLGTDLTPSLLLGEAGLGPISGIARNVNAVQYGVNTGPGIPIAATAGGIALGGMAGAKLSSMTATKMGMSRAGIRGAIAGGIVGSMGGIVGSVIGGGVGGSIGAAPTAMYVNSNRQLLRESPFSNTSLSTADALNATGDIVFGMHNSRRGY